MDDGHEVVGAEITLDELTRRGLDANGPPEAHVEIVDDEDVHAAVERPLVGPHVGLDRHRGAERLVVALDRNVDEREGRNRLRASVLEHLKVFLLQVAHEVALPIGHQRVDLDVLDLRFESGLLWRWRRRSLAGGERGAGEQDGRRR